MQIVESRRSQDLRFNMYASRLAMSLTHPWKLTESENEQLTAQYCEKYGDADVFHAAFSAIVQAPGALELPVDYLDTTEKQLHDMVRPLHLHVISVAKKTNLFVFHFFRRTDITPQLLHSVESYLKNIFSPVRNFHFAVGIPVCGIRKIYDSYSAAVIALQSTFFFEPGTCLNPERLSGLAGPELPEQASRDLTAALERADRDEAAAVLSRLHACCCENPSLLERSVQSLYYQLFAIIADQSRKQQLPADSMPLT